MIVHMVIASTVDEWRAWLTRNCRSANEVWLVMFHKDSGTPSIHHHEAVEHALCFGWIDGLHRRLDTHSSQLRFTPRRPHSTWSKLNRERAARMTELGLMTPTGQAMIDLAKATGRWEVAIPDDIRAQLDAHAAFRALAPSSRRLTLEGIVLARRPETRQRRLEHALEKFGSGS
jgi:uncharacterized protein YdeI (YjbR/CyaY-like superfamily)